MAKTPAPTAQRDWVARSAMKSSMLFRTFTVAARIPQAAAKAPRISGDHVIIDLKTIPSARSGQPASRV